MAKRKSKKVATNKVNETKKVEIPAVDLKKSDKASDAPEEPKPKKGLKKKVAFIGGGLVAAGAAVIGVLSRKHKADSDDDLDEEFEDSDDEEEEDDSEDSDEEDEETE
jgi:hypothetical protein